MIKVARHIILLLAVVFASSIFAQEVNNEAVRETFVVRGSVLENDGKCSYVFLVCFQKGS